jgi:hypothetical protein
MSVTSDTFLLLHVTYSCDILLHANFYYAYIYALYYALD